MTKKALLLSVIALFFVFCSFGYAEDFNVSTSEDFQSALDTAQSNIEDDVITLSAGYYPIPGEAFHYLPFYNTGEGSLLIKGEDGATVTLDGQEKDRVLFINSTADITLQNLTIKNGNWYNSSGGGAYIIVDSGDIKVKDCTFYGNTGNSGGAGYLRTDAGDVFVEGNIITGNNGNHGGGIWIGLVDGNCKVYGNTFSDNTSTSRGGGLYAEGTGNMTIENCAFDHNVAPDGGGMFFRKIEGDLTIENCTFTNNTGGGNGGGVYAYPYYGDFIFRNNLVAGNTSIYEGGGAYFYSESVRYADIINNTITGNTVTEAGYYGGGIYIYCGDENTVYSLYNNIVRDNTASDGDDIYFYDNSYLNYFFVNNNNFSVLSNDFSASSDLYETANIVKDPLFVSATDFRLQEGSPVIDKGDNNAPSLPDIDLDGNDRIYGDAVDMGAYEFGSGSNVPTGSSSGGGCNAGAFSPALFLLFAPLLLLAGKK